MIPPTSRRLICLIAILIIAALSVLLTTKPASRAKVVEDRCVSPPAGLVGWWPGEGNANDIVGGTNGILNNGTSFAPARVGQGFSFDGVNDYVQIPNAPKVNPLNAISIEAWFAGTPTNTFQQLVAKFNHNSPGDNPDDYFTLGVFPDGRLQFAIATTQSPGGIGVDSPSSLLDGNFHHVVAMHDGSNIMLYIDGALAASTTFTGQPFNTTTPVLFGAGLNNGTPAFFFRGQLDEVGIYDRALTSNEVQALFISGSAGKCKPECSVPPSGLVSWWPGDGNAVDIQSANNGTLQNGATFVAGRIGQAFQIPSGGYVSVPHNASLDLTKFTIDAWVNPGSVGGQRVIVDKGMPFSINYLLYLLDDNRVAIDFFDSHGHHEAQSSSVCTPGSWCHVAGTYDGSNLKIYVNGAMDGLLAYAGIPSTGQSLRIGRRNDDTLDFQGVIDEVEIFNRALTGSEIQAIYNAGGAGNCKPNFTTQTVIPKEATSYKYQIYPSGGVPTDFGNENFDDSTFLTGDAAFGTAGGCPLAGTVRTVWPSGSEIVLRKSFTLPAGVRNLKVLVAVDNDVEVFLNGADISGGLINHDGCAAFDLAFTAPDTLLMAGQNILAVRGRDRGGEGFLDLEVDADLPTAGVASLVLNPATVTGGQASTGTVTLANPAPPGGIVISISSSNSTVASVPTTITIPEAVTSGSFTISTTVVPATSSVDIFATLNGARRVATLTVNPPSTDLIVSSVNAPTSIQTDASFDISWIDTNNGMARATGPWTDKIYLSTDDQLGNDTLLSEFPFSQSLSPNESATRIQVIRVPRAAVPSNAQYFFIVVTDANNNIDEGTNENNNWRAVPVNVSLQPLPDLQVALVQAPSSAQGSQMISVTRKICNVGENLTHAPFWFDRLYLSPDTNKDHAIRNFGPFLNASYLGPGDCYQENQNIVLDTRISSGTYYLIVDTDADGLVQESSEANNAGYTPINLSPGPAPGFLHVAAVSTLPAQPSLIFSGQPLAVSWTVQNMGGSSIVGNWDHCIFLSPTPEWDGINGYPLKCHVGPFNGPLKVGDSYAGQADVKLPYNISGTWYVVVVPDPNFVLGDTPRDQNSTAINLTQQPPADLIVSSAHAASVAPSGQSISISWTIRNQGAGETVAAAWKDAVYLSTDSLLDTSNDQRLVTFDHSGNLGPGLDYTQSESVTLPACLSGQYYLFIVTDSDNEVFEFDPNLNAEQNNSSQPLPVQLTSSPPDLQVAAVVAPQTATAGRSLFVSWTVRNSGLGRTIENSWPDQLYISGSASLDNTALQLGTFSHDGVLNQGESYTKSVGVALSLSAEGSYYVFVKTNGNGSVNECGAETNNTGRSADAILIAPGSNLIPDLQVSSLTVPNSAEAGQTIPVTWSVVNSGTDATPATGWNDGVYISNKTTLDSSATLLATTLANSTLNSGAAYQASTSVKIPNLPAGAYHLFVVADKGNNVLELSEDNNVASQLLNVSPPNVDLVIIAIEAPASVFAGQTMLLSWTVINDGSSSTASSDWTDRFLLSKDQYLDPTDLKVGFADHAGALAGLDAYTQTLEVKVPDGITGPYYLLVYADAKNAVPESNETNNIGISATTVQFALPPPADLTVTSVTVPPTGVLGQEASISWSVLNQGANSATGLWTDSVYLSSDQTWDINDALFGRLEHSGSVAPSQSYTGSITAKFPAVTPGNYYVIVRADIRNNVPETSENNNLAVSTNTVAVDIPELQLGVPFSAQLSTGEEHYYKVNVPQGRDMGISLDSLSAVSSNELYVRYGTLPDRVNYDFAFQSPFEPDQEITVPTTSSGFYYFLVRGDNVPDAPEPYTLVAELLGLSIRQVQPNYGGSAGIVTVRLLGGSFTESTGVSLVDVAGFEHAASSVFFETSTAIYPSFDLVGLSPGVYGVRVRDGDSVQTFENSFTVQAGGRSDLRTQLVAPGFVRVGSEYQARVIVSNAGSLDARVPFLTLTTTPAVPLRLQDGSVSNTGSLQIVVTSNTGPDDLIRPGQVETALVYVTGPRGESLTSATASASVNSSNFLQLCATSCDCHNRDRIVRNWLRDHDFIINNQCEPRHCFGGCADVGCLLDSTINALVSLKRDVTQWSAKNDCPVSLWITGGSECGHSPGHSNGEKVDILLNPCLDRFIMETYSQVAPRCDKRACKTCRCTLERPQWESPCHAKFALELEKNHWDVTFPRSCDDGNDGFPYSCAASVTGSCSGTFLVKATDPNDKVGPVTFGPQRFVLSTQPYAYAVNFENISTATAPAQVIRITDQLDPNLDARTFRLAEIAFGDQTVIVPENRSYYQTRIDLGPTHGNILADISAGLDITNRRIIWTLTAIDPRTGEQPDPLLGLLPPNDDSGRGQGHVTYTIQPSATAKTGVQISNNATITFDTNEPITTNTVINTLDADAPTSAVAALPQTSQSTFTLSWSGSDPTDGSGLQSFDVWVAQDDGPYQPFVSNTTETSAQFTGQPGSSYRFYSIARDNAGNVEAAPTTPDAETVIAGGALTLSIPPNVNSQTGADATTCDALVSDAALGSATASDPNATITRAGIPAGNRFPVGTTIVTYTAQNSAGNTASGTQTVTIIDNTPLSLAVPENIVTNTDPNSCSAVINFSATASDNCSGVNVVSSPTSGSVFSKGITTVAVTATDTSGNVTKRTFSVNVVDAEKPSISCPTNIVVPNDSGKSSAIVNFNVGSTDNCSSPNVAIYPASGSVFPSGTTTVNAASADESGNVSSCSFTVRVFGPRTIKQNVLNDLIALRTPVSNKQDRKKLDAAISDLSASLDPSLWLPLPDETHLQSRSGGAVFNYEVDAVSQLIDLRNGNKSGLSSATLLNLILKLVGADRELALVAINDGKAAGADPKELGAAAVSLAKGDTKASGSSPDYVSAIQQYGSAWQHAVNAVKGLNSLASLIEDLFDPFQTSRKFDLSLARSLALTHLSLLRKEQGCL
jgi:subtilase family serine protease